MGHRLRNKKWLAPPLDLPKDIPAGFKLDNTEPQFDPALHLQLEFPAAVFTSGFVRRPFRLLSDDQPFSLGYTEPFRLLSDEGVRVLQGIVAKNEIHAKSNERIPKCLRGLGYRSEFMRSLTYSPDVVDLFSRLAGIPLAPHGMPMNIGHVNFGRKIHAGASPVIVDQWHVDSVDYVCVLILSDLSETIGGRLEVLHKQGVRENNDFMRKGVRESNLVRSVAYPGAGYCIFMQGSQILHRVSPVLSAPVPRISCVTSYMSRNVFDCDATRYHTFSHQDPVHVAPVEFARHQAWRIRGIMDFVVKKAEFGKHDADELGTLLREAGATLERSAKLLLGEEDDVLEWVDHEKIQSKL